MFATLVTVRPMHGCMGLQMGGLPLLWICGAEVRWQPCLLPLRQWSSDPPGLGPCVGSEGGVVGRGRGECSPRAAGIVLRQSFEDRLHILPWFGVECGQTFQDGLHRTL